MIFLVKPRTRKIENPKKYIVRDVQCLGCECFYPVEAKAKQLHILYGKNVPRRNKMIKICATLNNLGCPDDTGFTKELRKERIRDGWSSSKI